MIFAKILKTSFFTKLFLFWSCSNFCFNFFREVGEWLFNKAMVHFKIYDVTGWEKIIERHIMLIISRRKTVRQSKAFFLKTRTQNVVEKQVPGHFLKNQNWVYLWINSQVSYSLFLLYVQVECCWNTFSFFISNLFISK